MKKTFFLITLFFLTFSVKSQELNCRVRINAQKVKTTNQEIFQNLQRDILEFMNTTRWTNYVFSNIERIDCDMLITITKFNGVDQFEGSIQVSSTRPVYNTTLHTSVFNFREKEGQFSFTYVENQPLVFNENTYTDELTSVLAFYAYMVLGFDFDTFSELGGSEFFQKAQKIVDNAQVSPNNAWKAIGTMNNDNRYYLAKDLNGPAYKDFRIAMYQYHRLGLDVMTKDVAEGRQKILQALEKIQKIYQKKPDSYLIHMFIETKRDEIINIFSEAPMQEAKRAGQIMKLMDPTNSDKYDKMGQGGMKP